jgi:hypothetical protein
MPSLKNAVRQNSIPRPPLLSSSSLTRNLFIILCFGFLSILSGCEPTYPAKTFVPQLVKLVKDEQKADVTCHVSGKTLWVYIPLNNLVDEKTAGLDIPGLKKMYSVLDTVHRLVLSTDARLDFLAIIGADVKKYGVELLIIEYIPDIQQAVLEKFSRGEFSMRSVRDLRYDPTLIGDLTGESRKYYDISFDQFICLQIIQRTKNIFLKDKQLSNLFEVRSSSWGEKFGIIKFELEFLKKRYDLSAQEEKIKPIDSVKMIAASVIANYNYKNLQGIEITDTFSGDTARLSLSDLKKVKIKLPEFLGD